MKRCAWRFVVLTSGTLLIAGCGNKETREALQKASDLETQKQYRDANNALVDALQARETNVRAANGIAPDATSPPDPTVSAAVNKKVQADAEILKLERAQIPLYLRLERPDMASAVYSDILAGAPNDTVVLDQLKNTDALMRTGAVRVLGLMAKPDAIPALINATKDSEQDVRRAAVVALSSIKDPATVDPLIAELKDTYWFSRSEAAEALGQKHDARAVQPLIAVVADSDATASSSAQAALVTLSTPTDIPAVAKSEDFIAHLDDENPKIVVTCAICLALLKDSHAAPVLLKLVETGSAETKLDAIKGLGETSDPSVLPTLRETLKNPDVNLRGWSIIGLGNLKDEDSLLDLQDIAMDATQPTSIRAAATAAVKKIKGPGPVEGNPLSGQ